jgi:hypothetical protein
MVRAFGYCNDAFDTHAPGRLCRGRERWIEPPADSPRAELHRLVMSGATFSDGSARDAVRGLAHSRVDAGALLTTLVPRAKILAFAEAGDPRALPPRMLLEEDWERQRFGGISHAPAVRWIAEIEPADVDGYLAGAREGATAPRMDGAVLLDEAVLEPGLVDAIFHLVGYSEAEDSPARLYNPAAVPEVLAHARALVLLHLDKHGPSLTLYTAQALDGAAVAAPIAKAAGAFAVPFQIPPMLARWDRALYELHQDWDSQRDGEFPVPPAEDHGGPWASRRRRQRDPVPVEGVQAAPPGGAGAEEE